MGVREGWTAPARSGDGPRGQLRRHPRLSLDRHDARARSRARSDRGGTAAQAPGDGRAARADRCAHARGSWVGAARLLRRAAAACACRCPSRPGRAPGPSAQARALRRSARLLRPEPGPVCAGLHRVALPLRRRRLARACLGDPMHRARALIIAFAAIASAAAADDLLGGLVRNAWYWQARARSDKADDAWKQVLEVAPDNAEALAAVGGFSARAGRMQQAREMLARLEKVAPNHPDVPLPRRQIELGPRFGALLLDARKLIHEGHA